MSYSMIIAVILSILMLFSTATMEASPEVSVEPILRNENAVVETTPEPDYDVQLIVYLYDRCGGCGVDSPGCGNCQDMVLYHGIIKQLMGDRLYDGSILYRMFNCRLEAHDKEYDQYFAAYDIPKELYGYLPVTFIGTPERGVYLVSEELLNYVDVYVDMYLSGVDIADIQAKADAQRAELRGE